MIDLGYFHYNQKPFFGASLNRNNPLTRNLQGLYICNEQTGNIVYDYSGNNAHLTGHNYGTTSPWYVGPQGLGVQSLANKNSFQTTLSPNKYFNWPMTIIVAYNTYICGATGNQRVWGLQPNNTNATPFFIITYYALGSTVRFQYLNGSTGSSVVSLSVSSNQDMVLGATVTNSYAANYSNGLSYNTSKASISNPSWATVANSPQITLGGWTAVNGLINARPIYWAAWWNRELSPQEHLLLGSSVDSIYTLFNTNPATAKLLNYILYKKLVAQGVLVENFPYSINVPIIGVNNRLMR